MHCSIDLFLQNRIYLGMTTLKELIVKRPCLKLEFLDVLLEFTSNDKPEVSKVLYFENYV